MPNNKSGNSANLLYAYKLNESKIPAKRHLSINYHFSGLGCWQRLMALLLLEQITGQMTNECQYKRNKEKCTKYNEDNTPRWKHAAKQSVRAFSTVVVTCQSDLLVLGQLGRILGPNCHVLGATCLCNFVRGLCRNLLDLFLF